MYTSAIPVATHLFESIVGLLVEIRRESFQPYRALEQKIPGPWRAG
jgi:hypothetical protein